MTILISAQAITKSFGSDSLFSGVSLNILAQDRLGLIGPNGSGKSTLLKILLGLEEPDQGNVMRNSSAHPVYLAQTDEFDESQTIQQVLFGTAAAELDIEECQHRIREVTDEKTFADLTQSVATLSGGWRKRLAIVQALLQHPGLLLMDEPTNHLDLEGILWLETILQKARFSYVVISHDRYFLDKVAHSIVEISKIYPDGYFKSAGNYSDFLAKRGEFIVAQIQQEQTLANKMRREEEWLSRMPKARTTKAQYRIDSAAQLKADLQKVRASNAQNRAATIDFAATDRKTKKLIQLHDVSISRNQRQLFAHLNFTLTPGFCLGLMGRNGSGKSSLMNILNGSLQPDSGYVERADQLRIVNFDQKRQQLDQNQSLLRALAPHGDSITYQGNVIHVAAWAKRFLFAVDQLQQPVSRLSGGEQARVLIANLMQQPADVLLLDEPTNDLDIPTLEVLEDSLREFPGAVVLITHDRYLLDRLSDRLLYLDGQGGAQFFADYAQWQQSIIATPVLEGKIKDVAQEKPILSISYEERRELGRLPERIQKAEAEVAALEQQLHDPVNASDQQRLAELYDKIQLAKEKVEQLFLRWEELEGK